MYWCSQHEIKWPDTAREALKKCDKEAFPNINRILQLLCTYPVTTSESERTFSSLRRSTMTEERLNGLALMYLHKDIEVYVEECVE